MNSVDYEKGCQLPTDDWMSLNRTGIFEDASLRRYASPFPSQDLMTNVSGLEKEEDFAKHGTDIYRALDKASPKPLADYQRILDFGCGCGRLARMFKGHPHEVYGCDLDERHVTWIRDNLSYMQAELSGVKPPLPFAKNMFDGIISISVFTHMEEKSQDAFLKDLRRVSTADARLFLTVHGETAMNRALNETSIKDMLAMPEEAFQQAAEKVQKGDFAFILQQGHLTKEYQGAERLRKKLAALVGMERDDEYRYGITFTPRAYIERHWSKWFEVHSIIDGAIHNFQDIVVLSPRT